MKKFEISIITSLVLLLVLTITTTCYGEEKTYKNTYSEINAENSSGGYIKVKYINQTTKKLKVIIEKGNQKYTYDLNSKGEYDTYPLQMGDGSYTVKVFENITNNKYSLKQSANLNIKLKDGNSPFLCSNQYVNYTDDSETVKKAEELSKDKSTDIEKIDAIYDYIISNIVYDTEKAKNVKSGYLPKVDEILKSDKGICFDYSAVMAAMLRSQSIPTKLVTGYSSNLNAFHAWNEVYTKENGWIVLNEIYFDGNEWKLMDSTLASTAKQSKSSKVIEYTNKLIDSKNYTKQFEY